MRGALPRRLVIVLGLVVSMTMIASSTIALAKGPARFKRIGSVYVLSNETNNAVDVFARDANGALQAEGAVLTGGKGTGAGLGSQGAVALSPDGKWLVAVNAGSNDFTVFAVRPGGDLKWVAKVPSQGTMPLSVTIQQGLVYVLNDGASGNIAGFRLDKHGMPTFLPGSVQPLSNLGVGSAPVAEQIGLKPYGRTLVVTEKSTNLIDVYGLTGGVAAAPMVFTSSGAAPYGFAFTRSGVAIVSEAGIGALSSYAVTPSLHSVISPSVPDFGLAPCWVAVTPDSRFAYTSDAHSNDISIYHVSPDGTIALKKSAAVTLSTPLDLGVARGGRFLFALSAGAHGVGSYRIGAFGALSGLGSFGTLPASASGLAVW